uniref:Uncharacterized protein n=1 Tax=Rhizophora mucronata TaxID=61149 RepID=A0A2P2R4W6_RHIMU
MPPRVPPFWDFFLGGDGEGGVQRGGGGTN